MIAVTRIRASNGEWSERRHPCRVTKKRVVTLNTVGGIYEQYDKGTGQWLTNRHSRIYHCHRVLTRVIDDAGNVILEPNGGANAS